MTEPKHRADVHPAIVGVRAARAKAALTNDARNRALRTFLQGLGFTVALAAVTVLYPVFSGAQGWGDFDWGRVGFSLFQAVGTAVLAWLMRKYLDRSKVPTPLPPADPGEPDAEPGA